MTYQSEIIGGLIIGLGSALPLIYEGRIAGISGYSAMSLRPQSPEGRLGLFFILGLMVSGIIWRFYGGTLPRSVDLNLSFEFWIVSGLLVGFGSRLGGGCTSGHGVCGLGRASKRSLASVVIFMVFAIITAIIIRSLK